MSVPQLAYQPGTSHSSTSELWKDFKAVSDIAANSSSLWENISSSLGTVPANQVSSIDKIQGTNWLKPARDKSETFESKVLTRAFDLKVLAAQYAVHLTSEKRGYIFGEIDRLINPKSWDSDDELLDPESLRAFLKWAVYTHWRDWSSMGVSDYGNLLVAWRNGDGRVTAEILPSSQIRWTVSIKGLDQPEVATGICGLKRFPASIQSMLDDNW